jgi:hypothetical protein
MRRASRWTKEASELAVAAGDLMRMRRDLALPPIHGKECAPLWAGPTAITQHHELLVVVLATVANLLRLLSHANLRQHVLRQLTLLALNTLALVELLYGGTGARPLFSIRLADVETILVQRTLHPPNLVSTQAAGRNSLLVGGLLICLRLGLLRLLICLPLGLFRR